MYVVSNLSKKPFTNKDFYLQEDEWQINETYMDNISKYPKDWYKQLTRKKKPPQEEETNEKSKSDKRRSSNQQVKPAKDKQEASENGDETGGNKSDGDKEAVTE